MKRITAFICATIMTVSCCLIDGVIVSRADGTSAEGNGPVIKYNNPGIGVNVGESIDLTQYAVQFADGVTTAAGDVEWKGYGKYYKIPFASPAIPTIAGEKIQLSQYEVQLEDGSYVAVEAWYDGEVKEEKLITEFTPEKGVSHLIAKINDTTEKDIYVVAQDETDKEYVLYFNDFGDGENETQYLDENFDMQFDAIYSYQDFVNKREENHYLTKIRQGGDTSYYEFSKSVENKKYALSMYRLETNSTKYNHNNNSHLILPNWMGVFGDYTIEMEARRVDRTDTNKAYIGLDLRVQEVGNIAGGNANDLEDETASAYGAYLKNNYLFGVRGDKGSCLVAYNQDGKASEQDIHSHQTGATGIKTDDFYVMSVTLNNNNINYQVSQTIDGSETKLCEQNDIQIDGLPRIGRIGIVSAKMKSEINYVKVSLAHTELESRETNDVTIKSFTPKEAGVHKVTVRNKVTNAEKTIYVIAKNPEDTEYVLYENDFDTEADAAEIVVSQGGATESELTVADSQLQFVVKDSVHYKINDAKLQNFGNYRIEMTATTTTVSNEDANTTDGLGLFARETSINESEKQSYSVRLKYKYFDSDGAALSYDKQLAWGKYAITYARLNEKYVHSMRVQDNLIEYQVTTSAGKTGTILYDVREKLLNTGDVGFLFQHTNVDTTYKVNVDKVRVLFCPDEVAPNAPVNAKYTRTTAIAGMADGKITVNLDTEGSAAKDIVCYWGDKDGKKLSGYANFSKVLVPEGAMTVTVDLGSNIMVPQGAEKLLVYTENFQGESSECVTIDLPEKLSALSLGTEVQSFQVISDTHIKEEDDYASTNFEKFLEKVLTNDANTSGIFIGGDLVDNGAEEEYQHFNEIYASNDKLPRLYSIIGNHEFWFGDASKESWQANMDRYYQYTLPEDELEEYSKAYYARKIGETKFIFLNSDSKESDKPTDAQLSNEQVEFLETEMASTEVGKPTFIFLHQPLAGTVVGSTSDGVNKSAEVQAILENYPQAILFTSHSHVDLDQPGTMVSASEAGFNMFNTAAVSYLMNKHYTSANMTYEGAQGYYVEVYADKVLVRGKNLVTNEWMPSAQFVVFMEEQEDEVLLEDSYDFTNTKNIGYLDDAFVAHQYNKSVDRKSSYTVADDKKVADYFKLNFGVMANTVLENGYTVLTYNKADLKNFEVEYQFTNSGTSATGLIFGGQPGTFPITFDGNADNDYGVALYMTNKGEMYVYGAVDANSATSSTKATDEAIYPSVEGVTAPDDITFVDGTSYVYAPNMASVNDGDNTYTICVKVSNNRLTIYEKDNHKSALTVDLTDNYKSGYVSVFTTATEYGRFEKFQVQELRAWDYDMSVVFGGARTKYLNDAFDAYFYNRSDGLYSNVHGTTGTGVEPSSVPSNTNINAKKLNSFTATDNEGNMGSETVGALKAFYVTGASAEGTEKSLGGNAGSAALTYTKHKVKDFRVEYDFFPAKNGSKDVRNGLFFGGKAGVLPLSRDGVATNDIGVALYMTQEGTLYVYGAIDTNNMSESKNVVINQDKANVDGVDHVVVSGMTDGEVPANQTGKVSTKTPHYTMCVTVKNGMLSVCEKNHPDRIVKIPLANTYQGGQVSLFTTSKELGGFGGFRIQRLEDYDFSQLELTEIDKYFESYYFWQGALSSSGTHEGRWIKNEQKLVPAKTKSASDERRYLLTLKDRKVSDFYASTTYYYPQSTRNGIMVAPRGQLYNANNGILIYVQEARLFIEGAIDLSSFQCTFAGGGKKSATNGYVRTENLSFPDKTIPYVLNVKVEDGIVTAWIDGMEGNLSAKLSANYAGDSISLYSHGSDAGGFASFKVNALGETKAIAKGEYPVKISPTIGGVNVALSTNVAQAKMQGILKYDSEFFEFNGANYANEYAEELNAQVGNSFVPSDGEIPLNVLSSLSGNVVTLNFTNKKQNNFDYSTFSIEDTNVNIAGGREVACVDSEVEVVFDYKEDLKLDAKDLVRGKKKDTSVKALRRILTGEPVNIVSEDFTFEIPEDVYENGKLVTLGNSGTTTIYTDCTITVPNTVSRIHCKLLGPVTFDGVTFNVENKNSSTSDVRLYAQGYDFIVNDNVVFTEGSFIKNLYGGSLKEEVESTNLSILAGTYTNIYGGGYQGNVTGDTNVFVGGNVNSGINPWNHSETNKIHGGTFNAVVGGDTHITIAGNAKANIVYGGGYDGNSSATATVNGICYVNIKGGKVMGYYGGNRGGLDTAVKHTVITMTAGETEQIFGGSDRQAMSLEGSTTSITVTGGTVIRRIYGGCYNEATQSGLSLTWKSSHYVNGTTTVKLGEGASYPTNITSIYWDADTAICATSRGENNQSSERANLIFETQAVYNELIGRAKILDLGIFGVKGYDEYKIGF